MQNSKFEDHKEEFIRLLSSLLVEEKELESLKQELVLSNSFNLKTIYNQFCDNEGISKFSFKNLLKNFGIENSFKKGIEKMFEFYNNSNSLKLSLDEFTRILSPEQKEYKILLSCKIDKEEKLNEKISEVSNFLFNFEGF